MRGHPVAGGIAGFFLFLFLGIDLLLFGVIPFNSPALTLLPVLGIALGVAWGAWAPLPRRGEETPLAMPSPPPVDVPPPPRVGVPPPPPVDVPPGPAPSA